MSGNNLYLERNIDKTLKDWYDNPKKPPLLIVGARQVGKSESIKHFLEDKPSVKIDFSLNAESENGAVQMLLNNRKNDDLLDQMAAVLDDEAGAPVPGQTIFFFDEVQILSKQTNPEEKEKEIVALLGDLVHFSDYRFIFSGSLLGSAIANYAILKEELGFQIEKMYPLTLLEFFQATGFSETEIAAARNAFLMGKALESGLHYRFLSSFAHYLYVGGFPNAVKTFVLGGSEGIESSIDVLKGIVGTYIQDIQNYFKRSDGEELLSRALIAVESDLRKPDKKTVMKTDFSDKDLYELLVKSDIGLLVPNHEASDYRENAKTYFNDVGFMVAFGFEHRETQPEWKAKDESESLKQLLDILTKGDTYEGNWGFIYEQAAAEELKAKLAHTIVNDPNVEGRDLEYCTFVEKSTTYEIEFLWKQKAVAQPVAIEIKSGATNSRKSIDHYTRDHDHQGFLFSNNLEIFSNPDNLAWYPVYLLAFLDASTMGIRRHPGRNDQKMGKLGY